MINAPFKKSIFLFLLWVLVNASVFSQGTPVSFSSIPKTGTVLVYSHQDDDIIWMLPWWTKSEKFIQAAVPSTPEYHQLIHNQQGYLDSHGYIIPYESTWVNPWPDISTTEYIQYYWSADPSYAYIALDHIETKLYNAVDDVSRTDINKMKAKLEQFIASPGVSRIITHDNWGEYGNKHHKAVNLAVRELAVKYRKDVWMLGADGDFVDWAIPDGANITYSLASYDATLFAGVRNEYFTFPSSNNYWTWDPSFIPTGNIKYIKIVDGGIDKSDIMLPGETVTTSGPVQDKPGAFIFNGIDDYLTLAGNKNTTFTIGMWIKPDQIRSMDISKMSEYPSAPQCDRSFYMQSNGHITARIFDGQSRTVTSTTALSPNTWTHILMTANGSSLKIYINGIFESSVSAGNASTSYISPEFVIGQAHETASFFSGQISDVMLFSNVLSDSEIAALAGTTPPVTFTITSSAGTGGTISPLGAVTVNQGSDRTFSITPNSGYQISGINVDGSSVGTSSPYTFTNVTSDHTIAASFSIVPTTNLTISGVTANNKIYDGTNIATLNTGSASLSGVMGGDDVTLVSTAASGTFSSKNVGTGKTVITAGFTLTGTDANKYTVTQPTTVGNITPKLLTITGITVTNKVYDRNTSATLNGIAVLSGIISPDVVTLGGTPVATFVSANVATGITVNVSGYVISGTSANNYSLNQPAGLFANITPKSLTINGIAANDKIYDRGTAASLTGIAVLSGVISPDAVILGGTPVAAFLSANVANGIAVNVSGYAIAGTNSGNYSLTQPVGLSANITPLQLTISGITAVDKIYDRSITATLSGTAVLSGVLPPDAITLGGTPVAVFASSDVADGKAVSVSGYTISGTKAGNYTLTQPSGLSANISPKSLSITGISAANKNYDRTLAASLNGTAALSGVISPDVITLGGIPVATFTSANVANGIPVNVTGYNISGTKAGNYILNQPVGLIANISARELTITGIIAANKVYDSNTTASLTGIAALIGVISPDAVNLGGTPVATFASANAGNGIHVSVTGYSISGAGISNYTLIQPAGLIANITPRLLTVGGTFTVAGKIYDGSTSSFILTNNLTLVSKVVGDIVDLSAVAVFDDKVVGTGKTVRLTGSSLSGSDASNYTLTLSGSPVAIADITPKVLTIGGSFTISNKVYDGITLATILFDNLSLVTKVGSDVVSLNPVVTFSDKSVGSGKTVSLIGSTLAGTDAINYTLSLAGAPTAIADITVRLLSIGGSFTTANRVYDGTKSATIVTNNLTLISKIGGDIVSLFPVAVFIDKNIGTGKTVNLTGSSLTGVDANNYSLSLTGSPSATADISAKSLTIGGTFSANNKVYDGTTAATIATNNLIILTKEGGDLVTLSAVAVFSDINIGTGKTVSLTGSSLTGADALNYSLSLAGAPVTTADITKFELTIAGVTAENKVYDGTTSANLNSGSAMLVGILGNDVVNLVSSGASGVFIDKNVGLAKTVTISGFTLTGTDAGKYALIQPSATGDITPKGLTVTGVTAINKVYDRTTTAILNSDNASLLGVIGSDIVTLLTGGANGTFADRNVGTAKAVTTSGFAIEGINAGNYTLTQPLSAADITPAILTISGVTGNNRIYNGTTDATLNTGSASLVGILGGDLVSVISTGASGTFSDKNAGISKTVTTSGFTIGGANAGNYSLTQPTTTADILKSDLSISGVTANSKVYDGTIEAAINNGSATLAGVIGTDVVTLVTTEAKGTFSDKNAGTGKTVSSSGFSTIGTDADNYSLTQPIASADITPATLILAGVTVITKVYDGTVAASLTMEGATLEGIIGSDIVSLVSSGAVGTFADRNAGKDKLVSTSGFTTGGADGANYTIIQPLATGEITAADLTLSGITANNKVYDGTTAASLNTGNAILFGIFGSDDVNLVATGVTGSFADKNAGTGKLVSTSGFTLTGTNAGNYTLTQPVLSADITVKDLTVIANNLSKFHRTTLTFTGTEYTAPGLVTGDVLSGVTISSPGAPASADVGTYVISVGGGINDNYNIKYTNGILTVRKSIITASAGYKTKVYGSQNPDLSITYTGFINNEDPSVLDELPVATTSAVVTSDAGTYAISLSGGTDSDYDIILVNGTLEILKAPLTITAEDKTRVFGLENPDLTFKYSGFVLGQDQTVLDVPPGVSTSATINSDAGNYDIVLSGASDNNYSLVYEKGILTITKASQVIAFSKIPSGLRITQEYQLNATASSGLPVSFESSNSNLARLNGDLLTVMGNGNVNISARQEGNHNWNPATEIIQTIVTLPTFDNISSLFTPNNDGMNDYWFIPDLYKYRTLQVTVYNRFGQVVYKSDSYKNDWDGTWNGKPLPSASYYYILKSDERGIIKGVVNIVR